MEVKSVDLQGKYSWKARSCPRSVLNQFVVDKKKIHITLHEIEKINKKNMIHFNKKLDGKK